MNQNGVPMKTADMEIQYSSAQFHIPFGEEDSFKDVLNGLGPMGKDCWEVVQVIRVGEGSDVHERDHEGTKTQTLESGMWWNVLMKRYVFPTQPVIHQVAQQAANDILRKLK